MVTVTDDLNSVKLGTNIRDSKVQLMNWGGNRNIRTCCGLNKYENGYWPRSNIKDEMGDLLQIPTVSVNRWTNHFCQ